MVTQTSDTQQPPPRKGTSSHSGVAHLEEGQTSGLRDSAEFATLLQQYEEMLVRIGRIEARVDGLASRRARNTRQAYDADEPIKAAEASTADARPELAARPRNTVGECLGV